ncbi:MAG: allantoinase [Actinomycetota bacterium]|nr:allantoinase [Actinomycetota bacterium]
MPGLGRDEGSGQQTVALARFANGQPAGDQASPERCGRHLGPPGAKHYDFFDMSLIVPIASPHPLGNFGAAIIEQELYDYSPIVERPPLDWPNGKRVAFYVGLNIEHFHLGKRSISISAGSADLPLDPLNHGWRDYGLRVGIWRIMESLDRHGMRASVLLNSDVCSRYPQIIKAGRERGWAWLAHGRSNSILQAGMTPQEELAYLNDVVDTIESHTGSRPKGWLGPNASETPETPRILAGLGVDYLLDWSADDQPFHLNVPGMMSVPYSFEVNDVRMLGGAVSAAEFSQMVIDQYEQLSKDSSSGGRVMALPLHTFISGQPLRAKYLDLALEFIASQPDVWLTTSDEIASHYRKVGPAPLL